MAEAQEQHTSASGVDIEPNATRALSAEEQRDFDECLRLLKTPDGRKKLLKLIQNRAAIVADASKGIPGGESDGVLKLLEDKKELVGAHAYVNTKNALLKNLKDIESTGANAPSGAMSAATATNYAGFVSAVFTLTASLRERHKQSEEKESEEVADPDDALISMRTAELYVATLATEIEWMTEALKKKGINFRDAQDDAKVDGYRSYCDNTRSLRRLLLAMKTGNGLTRENFDMLHALEEKIEDGRKRVFKSLKNIPDVAEKTTAVQEEVKSQSAASEVKTVGSNKPYNAAAAGVWAQAKSVGGSAFYSGSTAKKINPYSKASAGIWAQAIDPVDIKLGSPIVHRKTVKVVDAKEPHKRTRKAKSAENTVEVPPSSAAETVPTKESAEGTERWLKSMQERYASIVSRVASAKPENPLFVLDIPQYRQFNNKDHDIFRTLSGIKSGDVVGEDSKKSIEHSIDELRLLGEEVVALFEAGTATPPVGTPTYTTLNPGSDENSQRQPLEKNREYVDANTKFADAYKKYRESLRDQNLFQKMRGVFGWSPKQLPPELLQADAERLEATKKRADILLAHSNSRWDRLATEGKMTDTERAARIVRLNGLVYNRLIIKERERRRDIDKETMDMRPRRAFEKLRVVLKATKAYRPYITALGAAVIAGATGGIYGAAVAGIQRLGSALLGSGAGALAGGIVGGWANEVIGNKIRAGAEAKVYENEVTQRAVFDVQKMENLGAMRAKRDDVLKKRERAELYAKGVTVAAAGAAGFGAGMIAGGAFSSGHEAALKTFDSFHNGTDGGYVPTMPDTPKVEVEPTYGHDVPPRVYPDVVEQQQSTGEPPYQGLHGFKTNADGTMSDMPEVSAIKPLANSERHFNDIGQPRIGEDYYKFSKGIVPEEQIDVSKEVGNVVQGGKETYSQLPEVGPRVGVEPSMVVGEPPYQGLHGFRTNADGTMSDIPETPVTPDTPEDVTPPPEPEIGIEPFSFHISSKLGEGTLWNATEGYIDERLPEVDTASKEEIVKYFVDFYLDPKNHPDDVVAMGLHGNGPNYIVHDGQDIPFTQNAMVWLNEAAERVKAGNGKIEVNPDSTFKDIAPVTAPDNDVIDMMSPTHDGVPLAVPDVTDEPIAPPGVQDELNDTGDGDVVIPNDVQKTPEEIVPIPSTPPTEIAQADILATKAQHVLAVQGRDMKPNGFFNVMSHENPYVVLNKRPMSELYTMANTLPNARVSLAEQMNIDVQGLNAWLKEINRLKDLYPLPNPAMTLAEYEDYAAKESLMHAAQ